jgi:hypothetical protein
MSASPGGKKSTGVAVLAAFALLCSAEIVAGQAEWLERGRQLLEGFGKSAPERSALTVGEIGAGLKEALRVGTDRVVGQLGRSDGFNLDPQVRIPLPESLKGVQSFLSKVGMSSLLDDLELRLNRAAEAATPKAKKLFWDAIEQMTLEDIRGIYEGPEDAATRYFQKKMSAPLAEEMRPIVEQSLADVGAIKAYDDVMGQYRSMPFVPDVKADLTRHVIDGGLSGIFYYLAREEAAIRKDPLKRTTDLLKRVFGKS